MYARILFIAALACLFSVPATSQSADWDTIYSDGSETRQVNRKTLRNLQGIRTYQIWVKWGDGRFQYIRNVVTDCGQRLRFEVTSSEDWQTQPFKTVFPGTRIAHEVDSICSAQIPEEPVNAFAPYDRVSPAPPQKASPPLPQVPPREAEKFTGSGFFVSPNQIVTNSHVASNCRLLHVRMPSGAVADVTLKSKDERFDLALLLLREGLGAPIPVRQSAQLGEDIMIAGFPFEGLLSADITVTGGQVNSLAGLSNDSSQLQISAPVQPGNSGGPVLDRTGAVIGVVVSKLNAARLAKFTGDIAQNINFAIKPEVLRLFLDANLVQYSAARPQRLPVSSAELAQIARRSTVLVVCTN